MMPESAKSVANYVQEEGYVNYALGSGITPRFMKSPRTARRH